MGPCARPDVGVLERGAAIARHVAELRIVPGRVEPNSLPLSTLRLRAVFASGFGGVEQKYGKDAAGDSPEYPNAHCPALPCGAAPRHGCGPTSMAIRIGLDGIPGMRCCWCIARQDRTQPATARQWRKMTPHCQSTDIQV